MEDFFYTEEYKQVIMGYLGVRDWEEIGHNPMKFFGVDTDEFWSMDLPDGVTELLYLSGVASPAANFTWGLVRLCTFNGKKVVLEENASPLLVYYKKVRPKCKLKLIAHCR